MSNSNTSETRACASDEGPSQVFLGYIEDGDEIELELSSPADGAPAPQSNVEPGAPSASPSKGTTAAEPPWLVNKLGGKPIFPAHVDVAQLEAALEAMKCKQCQNKCVLVFQISSPVDDSELDRVIQIYACVKDDCTRQSWFALRCLFGQTETRPNGRVESKVLELVKDPDFGPVLVCAERSLFKPYFVSVIEEPTGRENFTRNNIEALKLAAKFKDPDFKPAPIEEKYKHLKNYKPPRPPPGQDDLGDFEKFQLERLYGNDKDMYRFYKRINRYQSQIVRYDWEGQPLLNSSKIQLDVRSCSLCSAKRKFEFQLMSPIINYLSSICDDSFDRNQLDFSSIIVHSCSKNCSKRTFAIEDTYFMPDPDSRIFNKVRKKMLDLKLGPNSTAAGDLNGQHEHENGEPPNSGQENPNLPETNRPSKTKRHRKKKNKK